MVRMIAFRHVGIRKLRVGRIKEHGLGDEMNHMGLIKWLWVMWIGINDEEDPLIVGGKVVYFFLNLVWFWWCNWWLVLFLVDQELDRWNDCWMIRELTKLVTTRKNTLSYHHLLI